MKKYAVRLEFRYSGSPLDDTRSSTIRNKKITLGITDSFEDACEIGNNALLVMESKYPLHQYPNGSFPKKERFSSNGGCFGTSVTLVTDMAYLRTPFAFFMKIETLDFAPLADTLDMINETVSKYIDYKRSLKDE